MTEDSTNLRNQLSADLYGEYYYELPNGGKGQRAERDTVDRLMTTICSAQEANTTATDMITPDSEAKEKATSESPRAATGDGIRGAILKAIEAWLDEHQEGLHQGVDESIADHIQNLFTQSQSELLDEAIRGLPEKATEIMSLGKHYAGYSKGVNATIEEVTATLLTLKERIDHGE